MALSMRARLGRPRSASTRRHTSITGDPRVVRSPRRGDAITSFTAVCPLRHELEPEAARDVVSGLRVGPHSPFAASGRTHFGRIQVVDELMTDRRRPLSRPVVIVSADVDGRIDDYLVELLELSGPAMATVLGLCEGAPADPGDPAFVDRAARYLTDHALRIGLQYANTPGRTAGDIRAAVLRHRRLAGFALGHQDDAPAELRAAFLDEFRPAREESP